MRYTIVFRSVRKPHHFIIKLEDGRVLRDPLQRIRRKVNVGETGVLVQTQTAQGVLTNLKPDAIDVD